MPQRTEETITIKISKVSQDGEFVTWELHVSDLNGNLLGGGTAPTFASAYETAHDILRESTDENNVPALSFLSEEEDG
jgi:hypothetical protein